MARSKFSLAKPGLYLDPRPQNVSQERPYPQSVSIPFDELPERMYELPPKHEPVWVAGMDAWADRAIEFLRAGGRTAERVIADEPPSKGRIWRLWKPNGFLEGLLSSLSGDTAIDLACGCGRESVMLAARGFRVDAVDHSDEALRSGSLLASRYLIPRTPGEPVPIQWRKLDLESGGPPRQTYDLAVCFRYLHRPLVAEIADSLNDGGSFVMETFTTLHREKHGKPRSDAFILQPDELPRLVSGLEIQYFEEAWRPDGSHTARLWARKL